jgi:hypothetical protein
VSLPRTWCCVLLRLEGVKFLIHLITFLLLFTKTFNPIFTTHYHFTYHIHTHFLSHVTSITSLKKHYSLITFTFPPLFSCTNISSKFLLFISSHPHHFHSSKHLSNIHYSSSIHFTNLNGPWEGLNFLQVNVLNLFGKRINGSQFSRATPTIWHILLSISCVLRPSKKICQVKKEFISNILA